MKLRFVEREIDMGLENTFLFEDRPSQPMLQKVRVLQCLIEETYMGSVVDTWTDVPLVNEQTGKEIK